MEFSKAPPPMLKDLNINGKAPLSEDEVLTEQLYLCVDEFTIVKEVKVGVCSWNIDQKRPVEDIEGDFSEWLMLNEGLGVIAVGFQEVDMSTNALLREETDASKLWISFIKNVAAGRFEVVASKQLVGLMMCLLVAVDTLPAVKDVTVDIVRCGVANTIANKGSIGVRCKLHETSLAFATVHLAAHQNEVERRNKDFERITDSLYFSSPSSGGSAHFMDAERAFFFGDLNYRIDLPYERTLDLISSQSWDVLLEADQLKNRFTKKVEEGPKANFTSFVDVTPSFAPSYKYNPGTTVYDTSEKRRVPAWTDRILYKESDSIRVEKFFVGDKLLLSDHRPVAAKFSVDVTRECPVQKKKKESEIREKISVHGVFEASISLSESTVRFGEVTYGETSSRELNVTNNGVGVVLVHVHSFDMLGNSKDDRVNSRDWISVSPHLLRLDPGETKPITVKCCIDSKSVRCLGAWHPFQSKPSPLLSHLLVISGGQHRCWVETTCVYRFSCFGSRLPQLESLGLTPVAAAYALGPEAQKPLPSSPSIPKELWLLVDFVIKHGAQDPDLFPEDLDTDAFRKVQRHLDTASKIIPVDLGVSPSQMSHVLLIFLRSLQEPVLPYRCYQACIAGQKLSPSSLPAVNYNTFTYIIAMLKHLLLPENNACNKLDREILVYAFTSALLRRDPDSGQVTPEQARMDYNKATSYILSLVDGS